MSSIKKLYDLFKRYPKVVTDSRKIIPGCLFFALRGERFNGNKFAKDAIEIGAAYAIIDEGEYNVGERYILVDDVLKTLQDLAREHRRHFQIPLIAITGSNGKTTSKELVSAVMSSHYPTHFTKGNFNNHIGVPLTLLSMPRDTEVAIIEMGANHIGEIDFLCSISEPTHGFITNIGKAHLEGFGSLEGVKIAKTELYRYLQKTNGVIFYNTNESSLEGLLPEDSKVVYFEKSEQPTKTNPRQEVKLLETLPFVKVAFLNRQEDLLVAQTKLAGQYNFNNILMATAMGKYFKVPGDNIKKAIEEYTPSNNRSQLVTRGTNTFILDAYNANPTSMRAALDNLSMVAGEHKVAILGDMLELGKMSQQEHQDLLSYAQGLSLKEIFLIGPIFEKIAKENAIKHFDNVHALKEWFDTLKIENTIFLVKGSRGIQLENLLQD